MSTCAGTHALQYHMHLRHRMCPKATMDRQQDLSFAHIHIEVSGVVDVALVSIDVPGSISVVYPDSTDAKALINCKSLH